MWEWASEQPCLLKTAQGDLKRAGLSPNHKLTEEQLEEYQEGFQTEETVQTRPGALPDSQKDRQINALILRERAAGRAFED